MLSVSICFGWALVVAAAVFGNSNNADICMASVFAVGVVMLALDKQFPNRTSALRMSWMGPLLIVSGRAASKAVVLANPGDPVPMILANGFATTLAMVWLWRGYGFLLLLPVAAKLVPKDKRAFIDEFAREYPHRLWWILPAVSALCSLGNAFWVYQVIHRYL